MAIYRCIKCDEFIDNDYHPCVDVEGDLSCPSCAEGADEDKAVNVKTEASRVYWDRIKTVPKALKRLSMEDIKNIFDEAVVPAIERARELDRESRNGH